MKVITPAAYFTDLTYSDYALLDVRSPGEFTQGKLPRAQSLPLFSDAERAEVGTLYKRTGQDEALLRGLEIAGGKMRWLVEEARRLCPSGKVVVHCWRGGQRSGSVSWLLEKAGLEVTQMSGGYKAARQYIRTYFAECPHRFRVLSGPTGSGKTPVLLAMALRGANIIDLEGIANHKGSAFGGIGELPQPSSEEFENQVFAQLNRLPKGATVWLEDESRLIGRVFLSEEFYQRLVDAPVVELQQPIEWRVDRLVDLYGAYPTEELAAAFSRIRKKLGGQNLNLAIEALENGDIATAARVALVYYDKAYAYYGERRNANIVETIVAGSPVAASVAKQILSVAYGE
ncbi:tRNA 2-selenouridine(34) synthase MnmH [Neolewinella antarctica]|uniref:tRNA 2-selenouridine synthase n=1 Tax=Neolewinella antarctica TaxID=442734 RepID=A0ABX0X6E0_9BACT|nr:tRNA 2-selenouridine(34) synthase MnmH [Neolewinella antarctica]NJC24561.1 tRNA 2-selenouridine synthase [Neolewinella antarctica]